MASLQSECATTLNAEAYTTQLSYYLGQGANSINNKKVEINEVWKFNQKDSSYTQLDQGAAIASQASGGGESCTCSNYLKEIEWVVSLGVKDVSIGAQTGANKKYYEPTAIKANVVLGEQASGSCSGKTGV